MLLFFLQVWLVLTASLALLLLTVVAAQAAVRGAGSVLRRRSGARRPRPASAPAVTTT